MRDFQDSHSAVIAYISRISIEDHNGVNKDEKDTVLA
jgi:hypothetical protein